MASTNESVQEITLKPKTKLRGRIIKTTLAGAIVDVGESLPGVIHISQLQKEPVNKVEDVVQEGQEVDVWVRRVRKDRIELTMIEPLPLEWREIKPNMVVKGKVVRLESYGAFVDIGAERPGLIHISELAHGYIKSPDEVVREGDEVEAMVLEVNRRKKRIRLSMKALQPEPGPKDSKGKRTRREEAEDERDNEPELTAMEIAWRQALERAQARRKENEKGTDEEKAATSDEQEEILSRTLEQRVPTG